MLMRMKDFYSIMFALVALCPLPLHAQSAGIEPPYALNLKDASDRAGYTIIDSNGDGNTWAGSNYYFRCNTQGDTRADDWLISPAMSLTAGDTYIIKFTGHNKSSDKPEKIGLMAGREADAASMTDEVIATKTFTDVNGEEFTASYTPSATGNYYFGFHCTSDPGMYYAYVDAFSISAPIGKNNPQAVSNLTAKGGEKGAMSATISFVTPTANIDGSAIATLDFASVFNETTGKTVASIEKPQPGEAETVVDNAPAMGINKYKVVCVSANGTGKPSEVETYVGIDIPKKIGKGNWTQSGNSIVITWPAAGSVGVNGGYVDTEAVSYTVTMTQPVNKVVASGLHELSYTDNSLDTLKGQTIVQYIVTPVNTTGEGKPSPTFIGPFGNPYMAPFSESFPGCRTTTDPWFIIDKEGNDDSSWFLEMKSSSPIMFAEDDDRGMAVMHTDDDGTHVLTSPMVTIGDDAELRFWLLQMDEYNSFSVLISDDHGHNWSTLKEVLTTSRDWKEIVIPLTSYAGKTVIVGFQGTVESYNKQILLDNIRITGTSTGISKLTGNGAALQASDAEVYSLGGVKIGNVSSALSTLPHGVYILKEGNKVVKITK